MVSIRYFRGVAELRSLKSTPCRGPTMNTGPELGFVSCANRLSAPSNDSKPALSTRTRDNLKSFPSERRGGSRLTLPNQFSVKFAGQFELRISRSLPRE